MMREFVGALSAYGIALETINRLNLWRYLVIPILVGLFLGVGIVSAAWGLGDDLGAWMANWYPWETGKSWVEGVSYFLGVFSIVVFGLVAYKQLVMGLSSPFMSPLSEKIEAELSGKELHTKFSPKRFMEDLSRGLYIAFRNLFRELGLTSILFLLGFIPVFTPFVPLLIFLVQSYYAGYGNMDYTMERHLTVKETVSFVRRHRGVALGNGVVFMTLLLTGIGFLIAIPLGAVAATEETLKAMDSDY